MQSNADRVYSIAFLSILLLIAAWLLFTMMQPFLQPIFVAFVLAVACAPLYRRLRRWLRRDTWAALAATLLLILLVLGPLAGILVVITQQGLAAYENLSRQSAAGGGWSEWLSQLADKPISWIASRTGLSALQLQQNFNTLLGNLAKKMLALSGSLAGNLGRTLGDSTIVLFTFFFFLLEGRRLQEGFIQWLPIERHRAENLVSVTFETINANILGVLVVSLAQGGLAALGFLFCGMGTWLFWGVIAAFASLIPFVGTALIWVPISLQFLLAGSWGKALFLALWGLLVVGMSDNILRPLVVSGRTSMSTLTVFFALLGGLNAFGLIGLVAGPLVFTLVATLYRILEEMRRGSSDPPPVELPTS
jgi:predicted PurR-regulated permease PerM